MEGQRNFFQQLLGNGYSPRPFQLEPAKYLYKGIPTILSAPTGSGKTWAAVFPFLYAKKAGRIFADRLFYVLPQRTLVRSIYNEIEQKIKELNLDLRVTMQMGDQPDDPLFQGDIILTTIDQVLSNYIGASLSVSKGQSNIPPGAFAGAYFVFDEIHTVPKESLPTILDLVRRFRPFARFLLMTATIPMTVIEEMKQRIDGESVLASFKSLSVQNTKAKRVLYWKEQPLTIEQILHYHFNQEGIRKTIVVVNRVERAQQFYLGIKSLLNERNSLDDQIYLLHSRFLPEDRREIEQKVIQSLGKHSLKQNQHTLVIATQVIEVGLDLSSNMLITELAPANALVQRAGRCARFIGEQGEVYVFDLPLNKKGNLDTSPYFKTDKLLLEKTKDYLSKESSFAMTIQKEGHFIETIHQEIDLEQLQAISMATIKHEVSTNLEDGDFSGIPKLVREIINVSIIVHDQPQTLDMSLIPERFSIHTSTIKKLFNENPDIRGKIWGYRTIVTEEGLEESDWIEISDINEIDHYSILAIHSHFASYKKDIGLIFKSIHDQDEELKPVYQARYTLDQSKELHPQYRYKKESYQEHVANVRSIFQEQKSKNQSAFTYFANYYHVEKANLEQLTEIAVAFHDVGKLNEKIAKNYWDWQKRRRNEEVKDYLAHTDYDPTNQDDFIEWKKQKRIPHAIEGAYVSYPMVKERVGKITANEQIQQELNNGVFAAIARHHHSYAKNLKSEGKLTINAQITLATTLTKLGLSFNQEHMKWKKTENLKPYWVKPFQETAWIWYWFVVRNIRLADQQSQKEYQLKEVNL
ncbi:CRISPR-associated helicase Cas3' [Tepidibacillus fermentans]|uniref:CRISPR-associated Cas3 family helicase n=1 Tax=Tepidibacillus fermentans TaxID=1281767 RepID=A0A4R3K7V2_9BACI|nr:CRISPR-associated helicase Cas3' [Tepidibacillus fermentans]TCS78925.1 CRISPR-associated Cas3 family helicase [Tepidibacillus fermentans]